MAPASEAHDRRDDFPMRERVEDHAGKERAFLISCHEGGLGYTVRATEETAEGTGYEFAAYSETSPYSALGRLRKKMERGMATRHIRGQAGAYELRHDTLRGRISSDERGRVVLIVDGRPLTTDNLMSILATHEGWELELRIVDALE